MTPTPVSETHVLTKPLAYVIRAVIGKGRKKILRKSLAYAIILTFIDFDPADQGPKIVMVDEKVAIKLKGNIYTLL